jgi:hypothetical protein
MPLFWIYYFIDRYTVENIVHTVIMLEGCMVVWTRSGLDACMLWSCNEVIVDRVKVSRGIEPFSPMEIDNADTCQPLNGKICMVNSHLLPNNPARQ